MDAITLLTDEKTHLLGKIAESAQRGDSQHVLTLGERLEESRVSNPQI